MEPTLTSPDIVADPLTTPITAPVTTKFDSSIKLRVWKKAAPWIVESAQRATLNSISATPAAPILPAALTLRMPAVVTLAVSATVVSVTLPCWLVMSTLPPLTEEIPTSP